MQNFLIRLPDSSIFLIVAKDLVQAKDMAKAKLGLNKFLEISNDSAFIIPVTFAEDIGDELGFRKI